MSSQGPPGCPKNYAGYIRGTVVPKPSVRGGGDGIRITAVDKGFALQKALLCNKEGIFDQIIQSSGGDMIM
jgi:hypothetical protein